MPRFTLRDLFLATTLIAVGTFAFMQAIRFRDPMAVIVMVIVAGGCVGAGLGTFFQRKAIGAIIVLVILIAIFLATWLLSPIVSIS